jgi:hypothetical protein
MGDVLDSELVILSAILASSPLTLSEVILLLVLPPAELLLSIVASPSIPTLDGQANDHVATS